MLADPTWRYVALGHIHKQQVLNGDHQPRVLYSGSIERIDFGEEHEPEGLRRGRNLRWADDVGVRAGPRSARRDPSSRCTPMWRDAVDPTAAVVQAIKAKPDLSESVVRVMTTLRQEQEPLLVERGISRALEGAYFVAALQKDVERGKNATPWARSRWRR